MKCWLTDDELEALLLTESIPAEPLAEDEPLTDEDKRVSDQLEALIMKEISDSDLALFNQCLLELDALFED